MNSKSFEIQNEIRQNTLKAHETIKSLKQWETEMKENELKSMKELEQEKLNAQNEKPPPIRSNVEEFQNFSSAEEALMKMKSMSMAVDEDNKETEEQNNAAIRKKEAIEFKDKGNKFVKNKEYESAIKMYTRAIELCSDDPVFYSNRAQCYLSLEKYQECIDDATKAIELDPKSSKSYFRRMTAYEKLGDDRKAMQSCSKLLDLTPEDTTSKNAYDRIINRIMEAEKKKDKEKIRWSRRGSSSKITNFVTKPPHLCSKKPMKNVPVRLRKAASPIPEAIIDRIFDNNTGETVPEMDSKLFKPKFLISNEVSPPKIAKLAQTTNIEAQSVENNDSVEANNNVKVAESQEKPTLEELEAHKSQKKPTLEELEAHKSQKKPTLEELEAHKNHLITIPLTGPKFFAAWKELTDIQRFLYLKNFVDNNADIGKLGPGAQLNSDMLSEIINTIYLYFMPLHVPFIRLLYDLGQNSEVSTLAMFMEDDEKKKLQDLLLASASGGDNVTNNMILEIKRCFQIK